MGVKKEHYHFAINAVLKFLKDNLGAEFTPPVQKAWKVVLNIVQQTMISDNYDNELTKERIDMVQVSWSLAKDLGYEAVGDQLF